MKDFAPTERHPHRRGTRDIYRFGNGYAASVTPTGNADGREVAVLAWNTGNADDSLSWPVTPIRLASDGIFRTSLSRLETILGVIEDLPYRTAPTRRR